MSALDLEKHLINLYLQHQDDCLHNVPLRFPPIHDDCETSSLTFLTETDRSLLNTGIKANKKPFDWKKNSTKYYSNINPQ